MLNHIDNEERLGRGEILSKEALEAGLNTPEELERFRLSKQSQNSYTQLPSRGAQLSLSQQQLGLGNLSRVLFPPQQPKPPLTQPPLMQNSVLSWVHNQTPPGQNGFNLPSSQMPPTFDPAFSMQNVGPALQNPPSHTGYREFQPPQPPQPQMGMMPVQAPLSSGGNFDSSPFTQSPQVGQFGDKFLELEPGMADSRSQTMNQGQAQQPRILPPNEATQMFGGGYNPGFNAQQPMLPQNPNPLNAIQNQWGFQGHSVQSGYGPYGHPFGGNAPAYNGHNAANFNPFPNGN
jgi:hypothetical protein